MITCDLCRVDCTGHAVVVGDDHLCPRCARPVDVQLREVVAGVALIVVGAALVSVMVGVVVAVVSWMLP